MRTPWGIAQHTETILPGILRVHTAGHGGLKLNRSRNAKIPKYMRAKGGWYEEDCQWAIPGVVFAEERNEWAASAKDALRDSFPDYYEKFFNEIIPPGQSHVKDERAFQDANKNNWIVISASRADGDPDTVIGIATIGGVRTAPQKVFHISAKDYANRGKFGYAIPRETYG
jgi:hypothetical protein